jgi:two-component system chemotaxis sensor kinase CheA
LSDYINTEPMQEIFVFETSQLIEQLEQIILYSEKKNGLESQINEIFRIMHTIKGSSAMMCFNNISLLAHSVEDVFFHLRENKPPQVDYMYLTDIMLKVIDFIGSEVVRIKNKEESYEDPSNIIHLLTNFLSDLKTSRTGEETNRSAHEAGDADNNPGVHNYAYKAVITFEEDCEMESMRAFAVIHTLQQVAYGISHFPEEISDKDSCNKEIRAKGLTVRFCCRLPESEVRQLLEETMFLRELTIECEPVHADRESSEETEICLPGMEEDSTGKNSGEPAEADKLANLSKQNFISVNIQKMNKLMDVVGELVISESMVTQNPELKGLELEGFKKAARHLKKITGELQDIVMSMRMVPLSTTFQKMNRIVRDMSKKLEKDIVFEITGEETEVDKNIIEHISDPLIHLIRNAIDHGIETREERILAGKGEIGKITLEAKNSGGDVWIILKDDGRGLDKEGIIRKAIENNILQRPASDMADKEIYSIILLPGFSTKEEVTEFSGRGVGMDVVQKNIDKVGGTVQIDSNPGTGTTFSIKIPLTLAIMDGMTVRVGPATYTIPTVSIRESLKIRQNDVICDPDKNEMIMIRGQCYPILRLHKIFNVKAGTGKLEEGILILVESENESVCVFVDSLIGEQQVVVKALPQYIKQVQGISGCTLLGDGSISLIIDIASLIKSKR